MAFPELGWLPPVAAWNTFFQAVGREFGAAEWAALVGLANARIDSLATLRLDRKLRQLFAGAQPPGLATKPVRLAGLASSTVDHLLPGIRVGGLRRGIWLDAYVCGYGQYSGELIDRGSKLHAYRPDAVLFALDAHRLLAGFDAADCPAVAERRLDELCAGVVRDWRLAREAFGCHVVQQTVLPLFPALFGEQRAPPARLPGRGNRPVQRTPAGARGCGRRGPCRP